MKVRISADGSVMLDYHTYEFDWLSIIPLNAIIDGKEYIDQSDIVQKDLFPYIYKGINLKTSAASYGRIVEYFKDIFALGYDKNKDKAPVVLAKGAGEIAQKIIKLAEENGIEIRKDADLLQILKAVDINEEIPVEAFAAVAEIISYIYQKNAQS